MMDLGNPAHGGSQLSLRVKPHASDVNLRTRFGANNGSSTSLAVPAPGFGARFGANNGSSTSLAAPTPGFGARFGANNGSSTSLAAPGPGFGSRPGTPSGRAKAWVNPLDIHFVRSVPSGPPTPKSPLVDSMQLPPTPTTEKAETQSVFGEDAGNMVDAVMASVKKREEEANEAKQREQELEKERETARLDMERLERQKSTESTLAARRPSAPQLEPELPSAEASLPGPVFRGDLEMRPASRNGHKRSPPLHQGPPPTGPPTQCLPKPPGPGPQRQGPLGFAGEGPDRRAPHPVGPVDHELGNEFGRRPNPHGSRDPRFAGEGPDRRTPHLVGPVDHERGQEFGRRPNPHSPRDPRAHGPHPGGHPGHPHGAGPRPYGPPPPNTSQPPSRPYRRSPPEGSGPGPLPDGFRSPSPPLGSPGIDGATMFHSEPELPASNGRGTPDRGRQGPGPLISTLASPSTVTSPSGSIRRLSFDEPVEQFARPIIQNVRGLRDTLTLNTPRQHSLSMKIEEFEKTLLSAQQTQQNLKALVQEPRRRSGGSSIYSDGPKVDDDDDEGPILPVQPAPLRIPHPTAAPAPAPTDRPQSPMRGPPRRGALPRRPGLEEYGVSSTQVSLRTRGGTPTPASRSGSTDNYSTHSSPLSRTDTPQLRHPNWRRDLAQPSPAPTLENFERPRPSPVVDTFERARPAAPVVDTGFNFDFGPGPSLGFAAPPTPDSSTWSLASPTGEAGPLPPQTSEPAQTQPAKFTRSNVPPPLNLKFNFSADAPSRDPTLGMWTPPIRPTHGAAAANDERPSTSGGPSGAGKPNGLAASPSFLSRFPESHGPGDDDPSSFMGIGMARGPSIRDVRRPKTSAGGKPVPAMVDSFGTGFI